MTKYRGLESVQYTLDLEPKIQKEVDGIEMGILENGIPYLTQSGLAAVTGITRKELKHISVHDCLDDEGNDYINKETIYLIS